jgi:type IV secretion system protein TrbG
MTKTAVLSILLWVTLGWAQEGKDLPVVVRMAAPQPALNAAALQKKVESDLAGIQETPAQRNRAASGVAGFSISAGTVPSDFHPPQDVPLSPTAEAAVRVSEKWLTDTVTPAPGPDGRVLYTYGAGLATVVCAPLRVCTIELQMG